MRHYERTGKLRAMKTANGRRLFREADVQKLAAELEAKRKEVEAIRQKLGIGLAAQPLAHG